MSNDKKLGMAMCLLLGHKWVPHTVYRLESDTGRALYGTLCKRCGRFKPQKGIKEEFDKTVTDVSEYL